jgi:NAD-dependent protein deacetylases, SIR2 family
MKFQTFSMKVKLLKQFIDESNNIVFLGGAGVSTESGIPDFRSKDGLYNQHDINFEKYEPEYLLSSYCLYDEPEVFYEFYRQKLDCRDAKPNITHIKLAEIEKTKNITIVTQNMDGLHQAAGSKNVLEIHGSANDVYCRRCGRKYPSDYIFTNTDKIPLCKQCLDEDNPYCPTDKAYIRPRISLYGEFLQPSFRLAEKTIKEADLVIVGGTSLKVYPANSLLSDKNKKAKLVIINKQKTDYDNKADLVINTKLSKVFNKL